MYILVTNDDGVDSPAIAPLVRALRRIADRVEVVVPDGERSWIGKAVSRQSDLSVDQRVLDGIAVTTVTGYPADCTQLGLYNLFDAQPDLVVSGINIGSNYGSAHTVGSGTVGGAFEAAICGFPAIAVSACSGRDNWPEWSTHMASPASAADWEPFAEISAEIAADVLANGLDCDLLSVNMPEGSALDTPRKVTPLTPTRYGQLFRQQPDGTFRHDWRTGLQVPSGDRSGDFPTVMSGTVSIVPLQIANMTATVPGLADRFDRQA